MKSKFKKGQKVKYLGQDAVIRSINIVYGETTYNVKYKTPNGVSVANYIYEKSNSITI